MGNVRRARRATLVIFSALVGLFGLMVGAEAKRARKARPAPAAAVDCKTDADCVLVPDDCCDCSQGGKQRAIPKKEKDSYEKDRKKRCADTACTESVSTDPSCSQTPFCGIRSRQSPGRAHEWVVRSLFSPRAFPPTADEIARNPPVTHPIVRTNPRSRRKCLYVMRDDCTGIEGIPAEDSEALIAALADHIVKPQFIYRHQWRPGDVLMWDNCTVQHRAIQDYDLPQRRLMHRTTMGGAAPA